MTHSVIEFDGLRLTRVLYTDAVVPPDIMGLTEADIDAVAWREPLWADGCQPRVGVAAWIVETNGHRVVVDPVQAADAVLRADPASEQFHQQAFADVLTAAGFAPESIDTVVMTHIEGLGLVGSRTESGDWQPYFPNARIRVGVNNLAAFRASPYFDFSTDAWNALPDAQVRLAEARKRSPLGRLTRPEEIDPLGDRVVRVHDSWVGGRNRASVLMITVERREFQWLPPGDRQMLLATLLTHRHRHFS